MWLMFSKLRKLGDIVKQQQDGCATYFISTCETNQTKCLHVTFQRNVQAPLMASANDFIRPHKGLFN
jgi:hypothetical protein